MCIFMIFDCLRAYSIPVPMMFYFAFPHALVSTDRVITDPLDQNAMRLLLDLDNERKYPNPVDIMMSSDIISIPEQINDACAWNGVSCTDMRIRSITWPNAVSGETFLHIRPRALNIRWFPGYAYHIDIQGHLSAHGPFESRHLPGFASYVNMRGCALTGSINLTNLPEMLRTIILSRNQLIGSLNFFHLPLNIETIDLTQNRLHKAYVWNDLLPKSLQNAFLYHQNNKKGFRVECVDGKVCDYRIKSRAV